MKTEIEVKFLQVDIDDMREKLKQIGATLKTPMRLMRRVVIKTPEMRKDLRAFIRIRDEGDRITATYKHFSAQSVDGCSEIEIIVNDFDETIRLFAAAGLPYQNYQETRREVWTLGHAEIMIDEWPWVKPYIEIEANDEQLVRDIAAKLGFDWADAAFGSCLRAYEAEYPFILRTGAELTLVPVVKFGDPLPDIFINRP